jgi:hypothetical protein
MRAPRFPCPALLRAARRYGCRLARAAPVQPPPRAMAALVLTLGSTRPRTQRRRQPPMACSPKHPATSGNRRPPHRRAARAPTASARPPRSGSQAVTAGRRSARVAAAVVRQAHRSAATATPVTASTERMAAAAAVRALQATARRRPRPPAARAAPARDRPQAAPATARPMVAPGRTARAVVVVQAATPTARLPLPVVPVARARSRQSPQAARLAQAVAVVAVAARTTPDRPAVRAAMRAITAVVVVVVVRASPHRATVATARKARSSLHTRSRARASGRHLGQVRRRALVRQRRFRRAHHQESGPQQALEARLRSGLAHRREQAAQRLSAQALQLGRERHLASERHPRPDSLSHLRQAHRTAPERRLASEPARPLCLVPQAERDQQPASVHRRRLQPEARQEHQRRRQCRSSRALHQGPAAQLRSAHRSASGLEAPQERAQQPRQARHRL